ncbi:MAG: aquaporin [Candidatus Dormibacteraeota bacterium]|nr:aquaporin [Candidatus Dormibacteraeota bacterium]
MAPRHSSSPAHPARGGIHVGEWAAEFAGTAFVLLVGLSAVCLDFGPRSPVRGLLPSTSARLLLTGLLFAGSGSLVALSPLGRLSGAHLNPVVTLAFWLRGAVHPHDLAGYVAAQLAGAAAGTLTMALLWGPTARSVAYGATVPQPGVGVAGALVAEVVMTALLVGTILAMVSSTRTARWTPLVVWILAATLVWQGARFSGTGLNPARSLWADLLAGRASIYWVYAVGPMLGSAVAVGVSRLAMGRVGPLTAKLFHDPAYPSVFRSLLPTADRPGPQV